MTLMHTLKILNMVYHGNRLKKQVERALMPTQSNDNSCRKVNGIPLVVANNSVFEVFLR